MRTQFFTNNPLFDLTGDGQVNIQDLGVLRTRFFEPVGPSGTQTECVPASFASGS